MCQSVGQGSHQDIKNIGDINEKLAHQTIDSITDKQNPDSLTKNNADHIYSNTTLSKTPSISGQQLLNIQAAAKQFMISPNIFKKQKESHKKLLKVVSHTPIEVAQLAETQAAGNWVDITRQDIPEGPLYSWWSYRARDWNVADKGRRLDHIWATSDISAVAHSSRVARAVRGWEKPSDHAPVLASFDL